MRMTLFGLLMTAVWGGLHFYIGHRLIVGSRLRRPWSVLAWAAIGVHASLSPMVFMLGRDAPRTPFVEVLQWATYIGMGLFVMLLTLLVIKDLAFVIVRAAKRFRPDNPEPEDPARRTILTSGLNLGIFATSGMATGIGYVEARKRPTVEEVELRIPGLAPELDGFRIVQVSDLHVGPTIRRPFVEMVVDVVNELDADIVAVTGDLIDGWVNALRPELEPFNEIQSRHGVYYCTGNHEWYWDPDSWKREASNLGMRTLANEHVVIEVGNARLLVGGVDDYSCPRAGGVTDPVAAIAGAPEHDFSVLLAHQPKSCYRASEAGWNLQLSGHTHGGQFYPWNFVVGLAHPFSAGLGKWEDMHVYVNRGTGYWGPPLRLGIPSEITRITLRAGR